MYRHYAPDSLDERPGRQPASAGHQGCSHLFGTHPRRDRYHPRELHLRRCKVALCVARASFLRTVPDQASSHARQFYHRRRGSLHLPMGLRLPTFLPRDCKHPQALAQHAGAGIDGYRHAAGREGYPREVVERYYPHPTEVQCLPDELRAKESRLRRPAGQRQARTAHTYSQQHARHRHRLCP